MLAVSVAEPPAQIVAEFTLTVGSGLTVNVALQEVVQPLESVTVTVYVPATLLVMLGPVELSLHTYVYPGVPPLGLTVNICEPPAQIVALDGMTLQLGVGLTVNVALQVV